MHRIHSRLESRVTGSGSLVRSLVLACLALGAGLPPVRAEDAVDPKYAQWVEELANTGPAPKVENGRVKFDETFDMEARAVVVNAWRRLNAELEFSFPAVLAHVDDKRYSLTIENYNGWVYNGTVGSLCSMMIRKHLSVHEHYMSREPLRRIPDHPDVYSHWDWSTELQGDDKPAARSLMAAQIAGFEWAIAEQKRRPPDNPDRQAIGLGRLQLRLDELKRSGRPIRCSQGSGERYSFPVPRVENQRQVATSRVVEKQLREHAVAGVDDLQSPNEPPLIEEGRIKSWPAKYDRAKQDKVVQAIRSLNLDIGNSLQALANAAADTHYCVTVETEENVARNLTVGQVCCEMLAENVNVYRPYLRDSNPKSYRKWLEPTAASIAVWSRTPQGSLTQIQHSAFHWAWTQERQGVDESAPLRDRVQLAYLQARGAELWECRMPIIVDYLETRRVLIPPKNVPNEKAPDGG